jgi:hypothetical protein
MCAADACAEKSPPPPPTPTTPTPTPLLPMCMLIKLTFDGGERRAADASIDDAAAGFELFAEFRDCMEPLLPVEFLFNHRE